MRRLLALAVVGCVIVLGAFVAVTIASDAAIAQSNDDTAGDDDPERRRDRILDFLVDEGVITEDQAEEFGDFRFRGPDPDELPEGFDLDELRDQLEDLDLPRNLPRFQFRFPFDETPEGSEDLDRQPRFRFRFRDVPEGFDLDELRDQLEDLDLPEGFPRFRFGEVPEDFDLDQLREQLEDLELPEGFGTDELRRFRFQFPRPGPDGALEDVWGDIDREELRDAIENGTLDELVDTEELANAFTELATERIDRAVESGRITEERAAQLLERVDEIAGAIEEGDFQVGWFLRRLRLAPGLFGGAEAGAVESGTSA